MKFALGNAQNIGARTQQQDAFGFTDPSNAEFVAHGGFAAIVADGMGGMVHGDAASRAAIKAFLAAYKAKRINESIPAALRRALLEANQAVYGLAREMGSAEDMGTTLIAAVLHDKSLFWISTGDSGIFLYREGEFTLLNTPHIYARELASKAAAGAITREAAATHPERESLTSYLGMAELAQIDQNIKAFPIEEDDCVLLASDGMFKTIDEAEMRRAMRGTFQERCDKLVRSVLEKQREAQDNVTVIAIGPNEGLRAAEFQPGPVAAATLMVQVPRRSYRKLTTTLILLVLAAGLAAAGLLRFRSVLWPGGGAAPPKKGEELPKNGQGYDLNKLPPAGKFEGPQQAPPVPREGSSMPLATPGKGDTGKEQGGTPAPHADQSGPPATSTTTQNPGRDRTESGAPQRPASTQTMGGEKVPPAGASPSGHATGTGKK